MAEISTTSSPGLLSSLWALSSAVLHWVWCSWIHVIVVWDLRLIWRYQCCSSIAYSITTQKTIIGSFQLILGFGLWGTQLPVQSWNEFHMIDLVWWFRHCISIKCWTVSDWVWYKVWRFHGIENLDYVLLDCSTVSPCSYHVVARFSEEPVSLYSGRGEDRDTNFSRTLVMTAWLHGVTTQQTTVHIT
jgi:hypothetical protein